MKIYHEVDQEGNFIASGTVVLLSDEQKDELTENHVLAWRADQSFHTPKYDWSKREWYDAKPAAELDAERATVAAEWEKHSKEQEIESLKVQLKEAQNAINFMMFGM